MADAKRTAATTAIAAALALTCSWTPASAQDQALAQDQTLAQDQASAQDLASADGWETEAVASTSELRDLVTRYSTDRSALLRRWQVVYSAERRARMKQFYESWQQKLDEIDQSELSVEGSIDYVLLENELRYRLQLLDREAESFEEMEALLPFVGTIAELDGARRSGEPIDPERTAAVLDSMIEGVTKVREGLEAALAAGSENPTDQRTPPSYRSRSPHGSPRSGRRVWSRR